MLNRSSLAGSAKSTDEESAGYPAGSKDESKDEYKEAKALVEKHEKGLARSPYPSKQLLTAYIHMSYTPEEENFLIEACRQMRHQKLSVANQGPDWVALLAKLKETSSVSTSNIATAGAGNEGNEVASMIQAPNRETSMQGLSAKAR